MILSEIFLKILYQYLYLEISHGEGRIKGRKSHDFFIKKN